MRNKLVILAVCLVLASPLFAQKKQDERLAKSADALREILGSDKGLPKNILDNSVCVLIFPSVKKVAVGIGGSYGRGALVCRKGDNMDGKWSAPAMYALDQGSLGIQLGATATDFVLVIMKSKGARSDFVGQDQAGSECCGCCWPDGRSGEWLQCRVDEGGRSDLFAHQGIVCRRIARRRFDGRG